MSSKRAYGRVFYFGNRQKQLQSRAITLASSVIGNIEPEFDDILSAELDISDQYRKDTSVA